MTEDRLEQLWIELDYPKGNTLYNWLVTNSRPYGTMSSSRFTKCMRNIRSKYTLVRNWEQK